ncbi:putative ribonuclease H-like domain-containing protein [Tanacetum coccineum]
MPELEYYSIFKDDEDVGAEADMHNLDTTIQVSPIPTTRIHKDLHLSSDWRFQSATQTRKMSKNLEEHRFVSTIQQRTNHKDLQNCLFACFFISEESKKFFLYGKIEEEVYVCQPLGFEDPDFPDRVYKVEKALYGLHQAHRAWYETLSTYLLDNDFQRGKITRPIHKRYKGDILLVQVYVDDIIFSSTKKEMCNAFEKLMHEKLQMCSMGELTFLLGLQVHQKKDGIFISQDKYVGEILKKFGFTEVKTASTSIELRSLCSRMKMVKKWMFICIGQPKLGLWYPKDSPFDLVAYTDSDYAGASLDRKSTTGGCQFLGCRLISWQCKKQTVVANSTTEAEYVAASSCCGQVLWIQNQLLDYGYNFMHTKIFIDNNNTICIIKNPVFHSKTKHIEIRHHFIRDCNEKKLIQMVKIHTDKNVADLLTKAFDVRKAKKSVRLMMEELCKNRQSDLNGIGVNAGDSKLMLLGINLLLLVKVNAARHKLTTAGES